MAPAIGKCRQQTQGLKNEPTGCRENPVFARGMAGIPQKREIDALSIYSALFGDRQSATVVPRFSPL
jgi:hypothetical protein